MGIEVGLLSLAVSTAGTIAQTVQAGKARRARQEATAVRSASEEIKDRLSRRRAAREERIRRARLTQQAETAGASGASGLIGAQSALGANFGTAVAGQSGEALAARGVSAALQREAGAISRQRQVGAFTNLFNQGLDILDDL